MEQSIAQQVFRRLDADPYTKQAIRLGIANFSAIAKRMRIRGASFHAVKAAVRRYAEQMSYYDYTKGLKHILSKTTITLKSDVAVVLLFPTYDSLKALQKLHDIVGKEFSMISSPNGITIVVDQGKLKKVRKALREKNIISTLESVYSLILTSPEEIEDAPGWVAYVTELLAREGINIREYSSCYTDTIFVLEKKDALAAYELLDRVLGS